jgi:hypothetical protein
MSSQPNGGPVYICPMHKDVRQGGARQMPDLRQLVQVGTRFAMLQHIMSNPLHLLVMGAIMVARMIAAMMTR